VKTYTQIRLNIVVKSANGDGVGWGYANSFVGIGTHFLSRGDRVGDGDDEKDGDDENRDCWNGDIYLSPCSSVIQNTLKTKNWYAPLLTPSEIPHVQRHVRRFTSLHVVKYNGKLR